VGLKGTVGRVSTTGVVPACASLDCLTCFATNVRDAATVMQIMQVLNLFMQIMQILNLITQIMQVLNLIMQIMQVLNLRGILCFGMDGVMVESHAHVHLCVCWSLSLSCSCVHVCFCVCLHDQVHVHVLRQVGVHELPHAEAQ